MSCASKDGDPKRPTTWRSPSSLRGTQSTLEPNRKRPTRCPGLLQSCVKACRGEAQIEEMLSSVEDAPP